MVTIGMNIYTTVEFGTISQKKQENCAKFNKFLVKVVLTVYIGVGLQTTP